MVRTPQMAISHLVMTIRGGISQTKNIKNFDDVQILWNDPYIIYVLMRNKIMLTNKENLKVMMTMSDDLGLLRDPTSAGPETTITTTKTSTSLRSTSATTTNSEDKDEKSSGSFPSWTWKCGITCLGIWWLVDLAQGLGQSFKLRVFYF